MNLRLSTGKAELSAEKKSNHFASWWLHKIKSAALLTLIGCIASAFTAFADNNPYLMRTFEENGRLIDEILVPPSPPPAIIPEAVAVPAPNMAAGINTLNNVPAFTWCYGCSATSAGMMMGCYDNQAGYANMYTGPANGGVCPMNNVTYWGSTVWPGGTCGECPLVATHIGKDGRTARGYVEDYWIDIDDPGPDPYIVNGWTEHTSADCTGDFMGTSQSKFDSVDGSTWFYMNTDNSPLYDYTGCEPARRDGCHGMKDFVTSRGYTVTANFSQYIYGYNGKSAGFTYDNFKTEIDAGRPVLIQVAGHTMLGYGYNDTGNIIYIHNTWDNSDHSMTWGGIYSGMQHYGVTVLRLQAADPVDNQVPNDYDGDGKTDYSLYGWMNGKWSIWSSLYGRLLANDDKWGDYRQLPVSGDFNGSGKTDIAVYSLNDGYWYIYYMETGTYYIFKWGGYGSCPVAGDYDGDGKTDYALYYWPDSSWYIWSSLYGRYLANGDKWGNYGDIPVTGDFDGDGKADIAVYTEDSSYWQVYFTGTGLYSIFQWGLPGCRPACADYDGDGTTDYALYCWQDGSWYIKSSLSGNYLVNGAKWGDYGYIPVSGDFDGDGKADIAVYSEDSGDWMVYFIGTGRYSIFQWGNYGYSPPYDWVWYY